MQIAQSIYPQKTEVTAQNPHKLPFFNEGT
jgi:hypothetical protein